MFELTSEPKKFETVEQFQDVVSHLEQLTNQGSGKAAFELALLLDPHNKMGLDIKDSIISIIRSTSQELRASLYIQAFELLLKEAENDDGESMYMLTFYYQSGLPPVDVDFDKYVEIHKKSLSSGYEFVAGNLYSIYSDKKSKYYDLNEAKKCAEIVKKKMG